MRKKILGVTLFEMLLVLMVSGAIAVSTYKYQQQQRENSVANLLANEMYIYAQTVREYVEDNQTAITAGTFQPAVPVVEPSGFTFTGKDQNKTYIFTGVSWINNQSLSRPSTGSPYVSGTSPISFNSMAPLQLQSVDGKFQGDNAVRTIITPTTLTIEFGLLYEPAQGTKKSKPQPAISESAAKLASSMFDPVLGASSFSYTGGVDVHGTPLSITATLSSSYASSNTVEVGQPISGNIVFGSNFYTPAGGVTTGATASTASAGGSGSIENVQNILFDPTKTDNQISGLQNMTFGFSNGQQGGTTGGTQAAPQTPAQPAAPGEIDNVGVINFAPSLSSQINNLGPLNFISGGSISNLQALNFATGGTVANLNSISFVNNGVTQVFNGVNVQPVFQITSTQTNSIVPVTFNGIQANASHYFCGLSNVNFSNANPGQLQACQVILDTSQNYKLVSAAGTTCAAQCFNFGP